MPSAVASMIRKTLTQGVMKTASFNRQRMAEPAEPNPFLTGLHAPMDRELTLETLAVTGSIPPALNGRYIRIGPNPIIPPKAASHHWFLGDGMVHGLRLQAGQALWYRNRWVRSTAVSQALGEAPAPGPRHFSSVGWSEQREHQRHATFTAAQFGMTAALHRHVGVATPTYGATRPLWRHRGYSDLSRTCQS